MQEMGISQEDCIHMFSIYIQIQALHATVQAKLHEAFFKSKSQALCKRNPDTVLVFLSSLVYLYFQSLPLLLLYFLCDRTLHSGP